MKLITMTMIAALTSTMACSKKAEEETPPEEAAKTAAAAEGQAAPQLAADSTAKAPAPEIADEDIPVAADFEEAADAEITDANYKSQLADLKKEIDSDSD
jgi:type IV secretory pathway VirB10-like protein